MALRIFSFALLAVCISLGIITMLEVKKIARRPVIKAVRPAEARESSMRIIVEQIPVKNETVANKKTSFDQATVKDIPEKPKMAKIQNREAAVIRNKVSDNPDAGKFDQRGIRNSPKPEPSIGRLQISADLIASGERMLKDGNKVPIVYSSYQKIGFREYIRKMKEIGGRFFVGDAESGEIVAEAFINENDLSLHHLDRDFKKDRKSVV